MISDQAMTDVLEQYGRTPDSASPVERALAREVARLKQAQYDALTSRVEPLDRAPLSPRQRDILLFIRAYEKKHHWMPTFQEIADAIHVKSLASVHEHLTALQRKGFIERRRTTKRAIRLLPPALEVR